MPLGILGAAALRVEAERALIQLTAEGSAVRVALGDDALGLAPPAAAALAP